SDRIGRYLEDDRNRRGRCLGRQCRRSATRRGNHGYLTTDEIGRQWPQSIVLAVRPAIFDRHVAAFDIAGFAQTLVERAHPARPPTGRGADKNPAHGRGRWRGARGEGPQNRRTAEQRYELAPPHHSITSSAATCRVSGTLRPSVFAVLRLMTSSNRADCVTGRSAGFSPLRMRPV